MFITTEAKGIICPNCGRDHKQSDIRFVDNGKRSMKRTQVTYCPCNHLLEVTYTVDIVSVLPPLSKNSVHVLYWLPRWWGYYVGLFGVIIAPRGAASPDDRMINHERIHFAQQREMLWITFLIWYVLEFIVRYIGSGFRWSKAYRGISFEQEAYANEQDYLYLNSRKRYAWLTYL